MKNKKVKKILLSSLMITLIIVFVFSFSFLTKTYANIEYRDDGYINLYATDLPDLSEEEYAKVKEITFRTALPDSSVLDLLSKTTNVEAIYITELDLDDLSFLNNIESSSEISLYFTRATIDFANLNNEYITSLNVGNSVVSHFKSLENLTNLKTITFSEMYGYEKLDYTKFPNLESLALCTYVPDFEELIDSIPNVHSLSLAGSNIQNKDTVYLSRLTNLTELNLNQTYLTDIDFVNDLPNLEILYLPWAVTDLSPIYNLSNLNYLRWEAYTELFVTQELVDYLDSHNVDHYDYNPNIRTQVNGIISELGINKSIDSKVALEKIVRYMIENVKADEATITAETVGNPSALNTLINQHIGVCYHHSSALYTIAKVAGINDIYAVSGVLMHLTDIRVGNQFNDVIDHNFYRPHGWNIVNIDGVWYGIDVAQMNQGIYILDDTLFEANFLKNPFEDDDYDIYYAAENYYDFNYYFRARHYETDGTLTQTPTFEFSDINNLNIINHVIYNYDVNDNNAANLCSKVLNNYDCTYYDVDNDGKISTLDKVVITKDGVEVDTFILNTGNYVAPVKLHLGALELEYVNYPNTQVDYIVSEEYFNRKNPLKVKLKGENYDSNSTFETRIEVIDVESNEVIYTNSKSVSGSNINEGFYYLLNSSYVPAKEAVEGELFGPPDYRINVYINDEERELFIEYKDTVTETFNVTIDANDNIVLGSNNAINVEENSNNEFELSAKLGYKIVSIKINGVESIKNYKNNKITIENVNEDINIVVETTAEQYEFTEGNKTIYSNKDMVFKINGPLEIFTGLYINKKLVDPKNYKLEKGSTIITLSNDYLKELSSGEYTIVANYSNGTSAKATFTVKEDNIIEAISNVINNNMTSNPKTFDNVIIYYIICGMSLIGTGIILMFWKRINQY